MTKTKKPRFDIVIDCSENPYNLAPAAAAISEAVKCAMDEETAKGERGKPIVLIMGEEHKTPTHKLLKAMVIEHLDIQAKKIIFAMEADYTTNRRTPSYTTLSSYILNQTTHQKGLPIIFNDAARLEENKNNEYATTLKQNDSLNKISIDHYCKNNSIHIDKPIDLKLPAAMAIRNHFMATYATHHLQKQNSKIVIQSTGAAHVLGNADKEFKFKHSLAQCYINLGYRVITVLPDLSDKINFRIPEDSFRHKNIQTIQVKGLADHTFSYDVYSFIKNSLYNQERQVIEKISNASGFSIPETNKIKLPKIYQTEFPSLAKRLIAKALNR
jgi:hypothetical protein